MLKNDTELRKAVLYAKLIHRLMDTGGTYAELAEYTGLSYHTIIRYIKALRMFRHPKNRNAHLVSIASWQEADDGVERLRVLRIGAGRDIKQPRMSAAERKRRQRSNQLASHLKLPNSVFALGGQSVNNDQVNHTGISNDLCE